MFVPVIMCSYDRDSPGWRQASKTTLRCSHHRGFQQGYPAYKSCKELWVGAEPDKALAWVQAHANKSCVSCCLPSACLLSTGHCFCNTSEDKAQTTQYTVGFLYSQRHDMLRIMQINEYRWVLFVFSF